MIRRLEIWNHALIAHVRMDLDEGFHAFTGETGSGKSILLGALGLLLGQRSDSASIGLQSDRTIVEGDLYAPQLQAWLAQEALPADQPILVRREILRNGRSRVFINDCQATAKHLKVMGEALVDLHRQDDTRDALTRSKLLAMLDKGEMDDNALKPYQDAYAEWTSAKSKLAELRRIAQSPSGDAEYLRHQINQLAALDLESTDWEDLTLQVQSLSHATSLTRALEVALSAGHADDVGFLDSIGVAKKALSSVAHIDSDIQACLERLESTAIELVDLMDTLDQLVDQKAPDPEKLQQLLSRHDALQEQMSKHRCNSFAELLDKEQDMKARLDNVDNLMERLEEAELQCNQKQHQMEACGEQLNLARIRASESITELLLPRLHALKMPHANMAWTFQPCEADEWGMHNPVLSFSSNPGSPLMPMAQVASGGEKSRFMLALKASLAHLDSTPIVVLDEIDTGVSGDVAAQMGAAMKEIATGKGTTQVLAVTHLPQVAALADHHHEVSKSTDGANTYIEVNKLDDKARTLAIAKMLSGATVTDEARLQASKLIGLKG